MSVSIPSSSLMIDSEKLFDPEHFVFFENIDSTSAYIKRSYPLLALPFICRALSQSAGYGQHKRSWTTLPGSLLFSAAIRLPVPIHQVSALSQRLIITAHKVLSAVSHTNIYLKWPNDLYTDKGKIAGLLIEVLKNGQSYTDLCIGFGLNLSDVSCQISSDNPEPFPRLTIKIESDQLFKALVHSIIQFEDGHNLSEFTAQEQVYWQQHDFFTMAEPIYVLHDNKRSEGIYFGLDAHGQLNIQHLDRKICYHSGSLSIRKKIIKD